MAPVLTTHRPLPVRDLRRVLGGVALGVVVAVLLVALFGLVEAPDTVDRVTIENRTATQVEVGVSEPGEHAVLWLAAVDAGSTAVVEDVLDTSGDWIVRAEHAGDRIGAVRVPRSDLAHGGWRLVIPERWGEPPAGT